MPSIWDRRRVLLALGAAPGALALAGCGDREARHAYDPDAPTSLAELAPGHRARPPGHKRRRADRAAFVMDLLERLADEDTGFFPVSEQLHARQAATRALAEASDDDELVVAALCHDAGGLVGEPHAWVSARLLAPYVRDELVQVVKHHSAFQRRFRADQTQEQREAHRQYAGAPWFDLALRFTERYDQPSFDPAYETLPLRHFEPLVQRVFGAGQRYADLGSATAS